MKNVRRILVTLLVFLGVGEAVVRFDQATFFFQGDRVVVLANVAHMTPLYREVARDRFRPADDEYRVMVVGDSYLHGNHMAERDRFANRLAAVLQTARPDERVRVLDLTIPGANTFKNAETFAAYCERFRPHALVWAYNINDPYGDLGGPGPAEPAAPLRTAGAGSAVGALRWCQAAVYETSALLCHVVPTIGLELEIRGIVVPGTHSHHEFRRSHDPAFAGWRRSREILADVFADCRDAGIRPVVVNCPNLALLGHYGVLEEVDGRIGEFFRAQGVDYIRGVDLFRAGSGAEYAISRYDGHPNGKAHGVLAAGVAARLVEPAPLQPR